MNSSRKERITLYEPLFYELRPSRYVWILTLTGMALLAGLCDCGVVVRVAADDFVAARYSVALGTVSVARGCFGTIFPPGSGMLRSGRVTAAGFYCRKFYGSGNYIVPLSCLTDQKYHYA